MIIDSITLQNFGVYRGTQSAVLTPEPGKPIILFGGMNGGGKTTMLDAVQLALYGPRARISNRGNLSYKEYLREAMHRAAPPEEGAGVVLEFRRLVNGQFQSFRISRNWFSTAKGIEENTEVSQNGVTDPEAASQWDETIDAYLPNSIAHLFFFDGEQIMDLAEAEHAADILRTAIHSLLGLDLVDRLETDLKVFERRKRAEELDPSAAAELVHLRAQLEQLDSEQAQIAADEAALVNQVGRLSKEVSLKEAHFRSEGGELFDKRAELDRRLAEVRQEKLRTEAQLRELAAGMLPLAMLRSELNALHRLADHEEDIKRARTVLTVLQRRDQNLIRQLTNEGLSAKALATVSTVMKDDQKRRKADADGELYLGASGDLPAQLEWIEASPLTSAEHQARSLVKAIGSFDEKILKVERDLERVPSTERIEAIKAELNALSGSRERKAAELEVLRSRQAALSKTRQSLEARLDRTDQEHFDHQATADDKARFLRHSIKVRSTLDALRGRVVEQHAERMQTLILDAFHQLLRKSDLVSAIQIDPESFSITLKDAKRQPLPFSRLSAGERQLLATSLLWGLARASGRPIPTMIDTPLGRLDSTHRMHLASRYFPNASHQVVLLSTDEELVDEDLSAIQPFVSRTYLLKHDDRQGTTRIEKGYFQ